jgi:hypothetical protein
LTPDAVDELGYDDQFVTDLRLGVCLMVKSWGWVRVPSDLPLRKTHSSSSSFKDIERGEYFAKLDKNQKWSYWPVRLYKAGRCMWLFGQDDYYQSLKALANDVKTNKKEKLDYFSHTKNGKADVFEAWNEMEQSGL